MILYLLVIPPEKTQYPAEVRAPVAVARLEPIPSTRPAFDRRILQERQPLMYTLADADADDWFVLLDVTPNESGICFYFPVWGFCSCFCFTLSRLVEAKRRSHFKAQRVYRRQRSFALGPWPKLFSSSLEALY